MIPEISIQVDSKLEKHSNRMHMNMHSHGSGNIVVEAAYVECARGALDEHGRPVLHRHR